MSTIRQQDIFNPISFEETYVGAIISYTAMKYSWKFVAGGASQTVDLLLDCIIGSKELKINGLSKKTESG